MPALWKTYFATIENKITIPDEYKEFLLLHNGVKFFQEEYGGGFELFKLKV